MGLAGCWILELVERCCRQLAAEPLLAGVRLLLTAGPTREALDPVRYISNHSSGRWATPSPAPRAARRVTLVSGPVALATRRRYPSMWRVPCRCTKR